MIFSSKETPRSCETVVIDVPHSFEVSGVLGRDPAHDVVRVPTKQHRAQLFAEVIRHIQLSVNSFQLE